MIEKTFIKRELLQDDQGRILISEGDYVAKLKSWRTFLYMGEPRVEFIFRIIEGDYLGEQIGFFSGVKSIVGKPSTCGEFIAAGRTSNFGRALRLLGRFMGVSPTLEHVLNAQWLIKVITIKQDRRRDDLDELDWYSKIESITPYAKHDEF